MEDLNRHLSRLAGILTEAGYVTIPLEGTREYRDLGYIYENRSGKTSDRYNEIRNIFISKKSKIETTLIKELNSAWSEQNKSDLLRVLDIFINN